MKNSAILATLFLLGCSTAKAPDPILPIPTPQQVEWQKMEQYAFVHFGLNTFNDLEWGFGDTPAATFNPTNLDAEQWIKVIKAAGLKGVILTAKHHDGFCLWPSKYTEYSVKNAPWRDQNGDMVRELIDACKKNGLKVGLYLSPWDRNHAQYGNPEYTQYFHNQIAELINEYCNDVDLFEYWFDGANGGDGFYGGAKEARKIDPKTYYNYEKAVDIIHAKFPNAMIFGGTVPTIRWIGNESGWAGETNWCIMNRSTPESTQYQHGDGTHGEWLPAEVDVSIRPGWFYHAREDHQVRSVGNLVNIYYESVGRNANLLLNFPVALNGQIHPTDSSRIVEWWQVIQAELKTDLLKNASVEASNSRGGSYKAKQVNDGDWDTYWATEDGVNQADITFSFDRPTQLNRLLIQEYIPLGQRVKAFSVDYFADGKWAPIPTSDSMTTIGYKRIIRFDNIMAEKLRVGFTDARGPLVINNIEAFFAPTLMAEPEISRNSAGKVSLKGGDISALIYYTTDGAEPSTESAEYSGPIELSGKGIVKAIAVDPSDSQRISPVASKTFDVLTTAFVGDAGAAEKAFDSDPWSVYTMSAGKKELNITLDKPYEIVGFTYLPDQSRWGGGVIKTYELWAGNRKIAEGEFSNIKANPIEQTVMLAEKVSTQNLRFVAKTLVDGTGQQAAVAEFGIITE